MLPYNLIAGDTVEYVFSDVTVRDGFTGEFKISGPDGELRANRSYTLDSDQKLTIPASDTEKFFEGLYNWALIETDGTTVCTLAQGEVKFTLRADLKPSQEKLPEEYALEEAYAALRSGEGIGVQSYSIKDRSISFESRNDLLDFIERLENTIKKKKGQRVGSRQVRPFFSRNPGYYYHTPYGKRSK